MNFLKPKHNLTFHQQNQIKVIDEIEKQIRNKALQSSVVTPIDNFKNDPRIALTSVHFPNSSLIKKIEHLFITPLKEIDSRQYFYSEDSLHITIKNIKVIHDPPRFTTSDIKIVKNIFQNIIPKHKKFKVYFYKLILFPYNLSLIGTTDPELDAIVFDLNNQLTKARISDDKKYVNSRFFFSNITLVRFTSKLNPDFIEQVKKLSQNIRLDPYEVNSVSLLSCNAVLGKRVDHNTWKLK